MKDWIYTETVLLKACLATVVLSMLLTLFPNADGTAHSFLSVLESVIVFSYSFVCIRFIRGKEVRSKKPPFQVSELGIFGYFWRSVFAQAVTCILLLSILPAGGNDPAKSNATLLWPLYFLFTPFSVWIVFCNERLRFAKKVIRYFRG